MSNEVVYDESVKIRDFALENGQKSSVSPFKGQLLYDIDSNKVCYGKYNSKTQEVEWADLNTAVTPIKYAELKALRDSGQLVPSMQYRITDYVTTTTQEHTSSAGHTFDIVVTANTPSELSENAQARIHGDTDGGGGDDEEDGYHFIIDGYGEVEVSYKIYVDEETSETFGDYFNPSVVPAGLSYDDDGIPIIYFNDNEFPAGWVDEYSDYMKYNGRYTYDGVEYDSWVQYNSGGCGDYSEQDGYDAGKSVDWNRVHILTNIIVAGGAPSGGDDEEDEEHRITIKYKMFVDGDVLEDMYERPGGGRHNEIDFAMYSEAGEPQIYLNGEDHIGAIGGADYLYYQGRYTYNGKEYDKWLLYNSYNTDDENNYTYYYDGIGFTGGQTVMLTNIVTDGNGHFADWVEVRNDVYPMDIRLITPQFKIYIDESSEITEYDNGGGEVAKIFKEMDFTGYKNGTPVIYVNEPWHKGCTGYADYLLYDGVYEYNGTEYDKWLQYHCDNNGNYTTVGASLWDETTQDSISAIVVLLTNRVITGDGKFRGDVTNAVFEIIDDVDTMLFVDIDESGDADGYNDGHLPAEIYSLVLGDDGRPRLYVNDDEYLGEQDTDYYIYMGRYDYNGTEYDSWAKYSPSDHCYYIRGMRLLTNIVIETTYVEPTPAGTKFDSWVLCGENGDEIHENIRLLTNKVIGINMATPVGDDPTYSIIDNDVELKYMVHTDDDSLYANGMDVDIENMVVEYKMFIDEDSFNIQSYIQSSPSKPVPAGISLLNGEIIVHINNVGFDGVVNRYSDYMKYNGRYTYDGVEYDSWIEYISNRTTNLEEYSNTIRSNEDTVRIMVLTNIVVGKKLLFAEVYSFALDNDGIPRLYLNKEEHIGEPNTDYWRYAGEYWYDDRGEDEPDEQSHTGTKFDSWICYTSDDEPLYISFDNGGGNLRVLTNVVVSSTGGDNPTYAITDDNIELKYRILDDSDALYDTFVKPYRFNISSPAEITTMYKLDMDWGDMDWASYFHPSYPYFGSGNEFGYLPDGYPYVKYRDVDYNGTTNTRINYMKYNGTYNYDGVEYDSWVEFRDNGDGTYTSYETSQGGSVINRRIILTNIVVSVDIDHQQFSREVFSVEIDNNGIPRLHLNKAGYIGIPDASYYRYAGRYWYDDGSGDGENVHDPWFDDNNLNAWTLKYSLDNDTDRFAWADEENGKGVIYFMRDEFGNEASYDFKNILYKRYGLNDAGLVAHSYQNMGCMLPYEALEQVGVTENGCDSINAFTFCKNAIGDKCYDASLNVIKTMPYNVRGNVIKPTYDMNGRMCLPDVVFVNATYSNAPVSNMQDSIRMYYVISIDNGEEVYSTPKGIYSYWFLFNQTTNTFERRLYTNRRLSCLCGKDTEYWEYMGKWTQDGRVYDQWKRNPSNSHHPSDVRLLTDEIVLDENDNLPASRDGKVEKRIHRLDNGTYYVGDSGIKFLASGGINIIGATDSYYRRDAIIDRVYFQGNVPAIDARDVHNYSIRYTAIYNGRFVVRGDDGNDHYNLETEGEYDSWYVRGSDGILVFTNTAVLDVNALSWFNAVEGNCRHSTFSLLSYGCKCQYGSSLVIAVGDVENREYRGNRDGITGYCRAICTPMLTE